MLSVTPWELDLDVLRSGAGIRTPIAVLTGQRPAVERHRIEWRRWDLNPRSLGYEPSALDRTAPLRCDPRRFRSVFSCLKGKRHEISATSTERCFCVRRRGVEPRSSRLEGGRAFRYASGACASFQSAAGEGVSAEAVCEIVHEAFPRKRQQASAWPLLAWPRYTPSWRPGS